MRCWQNMGLREDAEEWLEENVLKEPTSYCPHCHEPVALERVVVEIAHIDSFFGDGPVLHTYMLKDGTFVKETIQAEPWSGGPVTFLCLELSDGTRLFEWPQDKIDEA